MTTREFMVENWGLERDALIAKTIKKFGVKRDTVQRQYRRIAEANGQSSASDAQKVERVKGGFVLKGKTVLATKPTSVWPLRFAALKMGMGYRVEDLAQQWHTSSEAVRNKAKEMKCLRYVEVEGDIVPCVVHPKTERGK